MALVDNTYLLTEFNKIRDEGFNITLPQTTIDIITKISEQVGAIGYIKTPAFSKKSKKKSNSSKIIDPELLADIKNIRSYDKEKQDNTPTIQKCFEELQSQLNKITDSNYDILLIELISNVKKIIELSSDSDDNENIEEICELLFISATINKMGVNSYAKIYKELKEKFPVTIHYLDRKLASHMMLFNKIDIKKASINDYNHFCQVTQINTKRRVFSLFVVELFKIGDITLENVINIIISLQSDLLYSVNWNKESTKCEEISENILLFIQNMCKELMSHNKWHTIKENIDNIRNINISDVISMSNKIKFKHMDMLDVIKKANKYVCPKK
tara:strand:- start:4821 stop:5807 length:987 start_codon:yes stop_codon:yes gene_type:complete